ncbi:hypothetical protein T492DRAFT_1132617 [Pavlovales sp. CCMP2436]|nr:hypothetical protein T492DRAFT_1132617 [Pavlovales sp. CCMP2436]
MAASSKWLEERRKLLRTNAHELVYVLTALDPECENFALASDFAIDNLLHHTFLDDARADAMANAGEQLDRLAERLDEHSRLERAGAVRAASRAVLACSAGPQRDALARAVSTLYHLSDVKAMLDRPLVRTARHVPLPPAREGCERWSASDAEKDARSDGGASDTPSDTSSQQLSDASTESDHAVTAAAAAATGNEPLGARPAEQPALEARAPVPFAPLPDALRAERARWLPERSGRSAGAGLDLLQAAAAADAGCAHPPPSAVHASLGALQATAESRLVREALAALAHALLGGVGAEAAAQREAARARGCPGGAGRQGRGPGGARARLAAPVRAASPDMLAALRGRRLPLASERSVELALAPLLELHARARHVRAFVAHAFIIQSEAPLTVRAVAGEVGRMLGDLELHLAAAERAHAARGLGDTSADADAAAAARSLRATPRDACARGAALAAAAATGPPSVLAFGLVRSWRRWSALLCWLCRVLGAVGFSVDHASVPVLRAPRGHACEAARQAAGGSAAGARAGGRGGGESGSEEEDGDVAEARDATADPTLGAAAATLLKAAVGAYAGQLQLWLERGELADPHVLPKNQK